MKYKELNINEKLFGKDYLIYDWIESDEEIHIYIKSKLHQAICPNCGETSSFFMLHMYVKYRQYLCI